MVPTGYASYRKVTTHTASPGDLLVQLYQAAVTFCGRAANAIDRGDVPGAHAHITRVQDIICELQRTLDRERGGELAIHLDRLYTYMLRRALDANIHKDRAPIDEIAGLLRQLLVAWQAAAREAARQAPPAPEPSGLTQPYQRVALRTA